MACRTTVSTAVVFLAAFLLAASAFRQATAGISCGQLLSPLQPCLNYILGGGTPPPKCCAGVRWLNAAAKTTPDRQTACGCLKSLAAQFPNFNPDLAASLPRKCGVSIPYPISKTTDCTK
ncbi:hypothetical protein KSP40_PGU021626 [Platanthera guangdongensis]|uniref:Non-specific lipid-transfer protein n=1 Tax=Platanthera guangdongensis TaxID=2320717 RepID=A0ABR2LU39_9ASPA